MPRLRMNRYLFLRRSVQILILLLFMAGNRYGWPVLRGDLSSSRLFGTVPLSDPYALLQVAFTGTMVGTEALLGGLIVVLFFVTIGGRAFCGWICPLNMVTDLAGSVESTFAIERRHQLLSVSRKARYWTLGLGLVLSSVLGIAAFEWISPVSMLHRGLLFGMGSGWAVIAAVFLFDLVLVRQGFCGHLCPLGGFYSLIGRASIVRVRHDADRCTRCMQCVAQCSEPQVLPMVGKQSAFVSSGECTNCGTCIDVCPDDAMKFGLRFSAKARERAYKEEWP